MDRVVERMAAQRWRGIKMFGTARKVEALEQQLQALMENNPITLRASLPLGGIKKPNSKLKSEILLTPEDNEAAVLLALINEYESLYRHYDTQKHYFAHVLILVSAGLSAAPSLLSLRPGATLLFSIFSAAGIIVLSVAGLFALNHLRERMKQMYHRSKGLVEILDSKYPELEIGAVVKEAKEDARKRLKEERRPLLWKRGALWDVIPWVTIVYAVVYIFAVIVPLCNRLTN